MSFSTGWSGLFDPPTDRLRKLLADEQTTDSEIRVDRVNGWRLDGPVTHRGK